MRRLPLGIPSAEMLTLNERIKHLDSLRFIALLGVFVETYWLFFQPHDAANVAHALGAAGLNLLFVLSGYLTCRSLLARFSARGGMSKEGLTQFYVRRLARIAPVCLIAGMLYLVCASVVGPVTHLWTIALQVSFMLVLPLALAHLRLPLVAISLVCLIAAGPVLSNSPYVVAAEFVALGSFLSILQAHSAKWFTSYSTFFAGAGAVILVAYFLRAAIHGESSTAMLQVCLPLIVFGLANTKSPAVLGMLDKPWLRYLGSMSLGLYAYHSLCVHATHQVLQRTATEIPVVGEIAISSFLTLAIAAVSWHWLERTPPEEQQVPAIVRGGREASQITVG